MELEFEFEAELIGSPGLRGFLHRTGRKRNRGNRPIGIVVVAVTSQDTGIGHVALDTFGRVQLRLQRYRVLARPEARDGDSDSQTKQQGLLHYASLARTEKVRSANVRFRTACG